MTGSLRARKLPIITRRRQISLLKSTISMRILEHIVSILNQGHTDIPGCIANHRSPCIVQLLKDTLSHTAPLSPVVRERRAAPTLGLKMSHYLAAMPATQEWPIGTGDPSTLALETVLGTSHPRLLHTLGKHRIRRPKCQNLWP